MANQLFGFTAIVESNVHQKKAEVAEEIWSIWNSFTDDEELIISLLILADAKQNFAFTPQSPPKHPFDPRDFNALMRRLPGFKPNNSTQVNQTLG